MNKKVGLLLPRSVIYPSISFDLMGGLRCCLDDAGINDIEIKTESIGLATDDKLVYSACEKLLFDGASIVAGYINPTTAEKLEPLFASAHALFISMDAGYLFPAKLKKLPHIFYLSLNGALCIRTVIKTAIENGSKNIAFAGSYYEAGYRSPFACHRAVEDGGGQVTYNLITPLKRSEFTLQPLVDHLKSSPEDGVFASFCGDMLQDFCTAAAAGNVFTDNVVYGSSFVGEEQWLAQSPYPGIDICVCVPWASRLDNTANVHFMAQLKQNNQKINIFSLLGWECAEVISEILTCADINEAIHKLEGYTFCSPRGTVILDADTHQCVVPVYEAKVIKDNNTGNCLLQPIGESPYWEEQRILLEKDINAITGPMTTWYNAYACIDS